MTDPRVTELGRRQALLARMRNVAREATGDEPVRRVHLTVAIDRFLVRLLATTSWGTWVLKGGYANQLRHPGEARFTEDVDLRIDAAIDLASGMVAAAIGHVLDDSFTYELPAAPRRLPGPPGGGLRFVVVARVAGAELVRFKLDISSRDAITGELERHPSDPVVELLGLPAAWFPVYPVAQQFAEKLHAYTLPRDVENTRAKDLADMVWLTQRHAFSSDVLIEAATATFARLASHAWPPVPAEPPAAWARQYTSLRKEMALEPATAHEAHDVLMAFLEPAASAGDVKLEIADEEREEIRAQMGGGPVQGYQRWVRWKQVYRSATQDPIVLIEHYTRNAGGGVEPESGWDTGGVETPTPSGVVQRDARRGFKVSMYGAVDPAWDYVDRVAIMRDRPECVPLWKDESVLDRIAREVPVPAAPEPD